MFRLCHLAALTGTALLLAAAQPTGAAAQASERYYTYSVRIADPANPGRERVDQYRMPRELAEQMYALGFLLRARNRQLLAQNPALLLSMSDLLQSIDEPETGGVRLPLGIEGIERIEGIELVGGTFPGSPEHGGFRGGDASEGGDGDGGGGDD